MRRFLELLRRRLITAYFEADLFAMDARLDLLLGDV